MQSVRLVFEHTVSVDFIVRSSGDDELNFRNSGHFWSDEAFEVSFSNEHPERCLLANFTASTQFGGREHLSALSRFLDPDSSKMPVRFRVVGFSVRIFGWTIRGHEFSWWLCEANALLLIADAVEIG